ncbi:MAG: hypothetical protein OQK98_07035 [Gammaproteobacteria bacterium]|nr:hypothetical protein [Gammaproteobacteria bacterium]
MADRNAMIKELIAMQKKFIEDEHKNGFNAQQYFTPDSGSALDGYRDEFNEKSQALVDVAHADKGSHR